MGKELLINQRLKRQTAYEAIGRNKLTKSCLFSFNFLNLMLKASSESSITISYFSKKQVTIKNTS